MQKEILTAKDLAERLQLKPETIRLWARRGLIPSLRPTPKVLRFQLESVLAAIENIRHGGKNE
jgi:DNA-binding transcriptional MerR regulator